MMISVRDMEGEYFPIWITFNGHTQKLSRKAAIELGEARLKAEEYEARFQMILERMRKLKTKKQEERVGVQVE